MIHYTKKILNEGKTLLKEFHGEEEFEDDFPRLKYDKIIGLLKKLKYKVTSDYYDGGFDLNDGEYFAGMFNNKISIHLGVNEDADEIMRIVHFDKDYNVVKDVKKTERLKKVKNPGPVYSWIFDTKIKDWVKVSKTKYNDKLNRWESAD